MYIEPWLFLVLVFGTSLSVAGLLIGAVAIIMLWIRRRPRPDRMVLHGPQGQIEIVGADGRPL